MSGSGVPTSIPSRICQIYLDIDTKEVWVATGVTAATDWKKSYTSVRTDDISNPPTDAELDALFGTPATAGAGFTVYIDDNGGGSNFYHIVSDGANWWIFTGAKAT